MTQPRGGYRAPARPAPASGPGRLARRTDGGPGDPKQPIRDLPNPAYGEQQTFRDIQAGAPMAAGTRDSQIAPLDLSNVTPLGAPSTRGDQPVTAGAGAGPGPGLDALGLTAPQDPGVRTLAAYLPGLEKMASMPQASRGFKMWVRQVRALL